MNVPMMKAPKICIGVMGRWPPKMNLVARANTEPSNMAKPT